MQTYRAIVHWKEGNDEVVAEQQQTYEDAMQAVQNWFRINEIDINPFTIERESTVASQTYNLHPAAEVAAAINAVCRKRIEKRDLSINEQDAIEILTDVADELFDRFGAMKQAD